MNWGYIANILKLVVQALNAGSPAPYIGAHEDTRTDEEKANAWQATEVLAFGAPVFRPVSVGDWAHYTPRNQDGSGSCVANSQAKRCEVAYTLAQKKAIAFSHAPVYQKRANRPSTGMGYPDAPKLQISIGTCLETLMPSQNMNDVQIDAAVLPADYEEINDTAKPTVYLELPQTFNDVAYHIEQNGGAIFWVSSDMSVFDRGVPQVGGKGGNIRHSVCGVDAITYNGVRYIVIDDSFGYWSKGDTTNPLEKLLAERRQRLVTAEFFAEAVFLAYDLATFTYETPAQVPAFDPFATIAHYGQKSKEIARIQDYLKAKGVFPTNVDSTGYYGNITAQAVLAFQLRYNVDTVPTLNALKGRWVGAKTLRAMNANL